MQSLPFLIAHRYLFAKKSQNIINIISVISALGIMVGTAALIIVLSVFNGLNNFVGSLFGSFDPDLKIVPVEGKTFDADSAYVAQLVDIEGVAAVSAVLADNALLRYGEKQMPAMVMGVDDQYSRVTDIDSIIYNGTFNVGLWKVNNCALGAILANQLGINLQYSSDKLILYSPKRTGNINMAMPEQSFVQQSANVTGIFAVQQIDYDSNYAIVGLQQAKDLFCYTADEVSALCVRVEPSANADRVKALIAAASPETVCVKDKWEQHESFFKMMEVEKLMAFLILAFIIVIAAFNIIGSLSMLIFEKKESIFILKSMGASKSLVTKVFLFEGWLVSIGGVLIGLVIGAVLVLLQQHYGFISFSDAENYIIDAYPVDLQMSDVLLTFVTVVIVGILAAWYPVKSIVGKYYSSAE